MQPRETVSRLLESDAFREWKNKHPDAYLVHVFALAENLSGSDAQQLPALGGWQVGYYLKKQDRVVTFTLADTIEASDPSEAFKEKGEPIGQLDMGDVKIGIDEALRLAKETQERQYPNDRPNNIIIVLQHLEMGTVYNITAVTASFNTLNMKIDAENGTVLEHKLSRLADFTRQ